MPSGKLAGRTSRGCCGMYSRISLRSQIWFPPVRTSTPAANNCSAIRGVMPNPAAEFSPLAITRSIWRVSTISASRSDDNVAPGRSHNVANKQNFHLVPYLTANPGCPVSVRQEHMRKPRGRTDTKRNWLFPKTKKWSGPLRRVELDPEPPVKSGRPAPAIRLSRSEPKSAAGHAHGPSDSGTRRFSIGSKDRRVQAPALQAYSGLHSSKSSGGPSSGGPVLLRMFRTAKGCCI